MGIRSEKLSAANAQIAPKVNEQRFQDIRRNAMQAYIKYKAYYDKKALQYLKNAFMFLCYNRKHIIKAVEVFPQSSVGMVPTSLKRFCQIKII